MRGEYEKSEPVPNYSSPITPYQHFLTRMAIASVSRTVISFFESSGYNITRLAMLK
jgi:hypothetical protein